jgi:carbamate kinase
MRIVIALGGNALGDNASSQKLATVNVAKEISKIIELGHDVVITHGNGPQVGLINKAFENLANFNPTDAMAFPECNAMSAGYIGYHLQNSLENEFIRKNIYKRVSTIITQVAVDKFDEAFLNPSKPIGRFYSFEEAKVLEINNNYTMMEDAGRGYRRVVPSPRPIRIIETDVVKSLIKENHVVIACGGGGIPVIIENNEIQGIDAVIDKDLASSMLARDLNADILLIITTVENVYINFNTTNELSLKNVSYEEALKYIERDEFKKGSMLPKVEAAISFIKDDPKRVSIITNIENAVRSLIDNIGTKFYYRKGVE